MQYSIINYYYHAIVLVIITITIKLYILHIYFINEKLYL